MSDDLFEIQLHVRGPEMVNDRGYPNRDQLASLTVPVRPDVAWRIYQEAVNAAVRPQVLIFPEGITAAEAEEIRRKWNEPAA